MAKLNQQDQAAIKAAIARPSAAAKVIAKAEEAAIVVQDAIASLDQTVTDPPTQAEVQAISDKVDEILVALRAAGVIAES